LRACAIIPTFSTLCAGLFGTILNILTKVPRPKMKKKKEKQKEERMVNEEEAKVNEQDSASQHIPEKKRNVAFEIEPDFTRR